MKRLLFISLLFSCNAHAQLQPFLPRSGSTVSHDSIVLQFRGTTTTPATGVTAVMYGNPHSAVLSYTNATYGITVTTVNTAANGNWLAYSGCSCSSNDAVSGASGGDAIAGVGSSAYNSIIFNNNTFFDTTKAQFQISGLTPGVVYTIEITGSIGSLGFDADPTRFHIAGGTVTSGGNNTTGQVAGNTIVDLNGNVTTMHDKAKFILTSNVSGIIKVWMNSVSGSSTISAASLLKIKW